MPESPDFAEFARLVLTADANEWTTFHRRNDLTLVAHIAEQLRQIWNARGAVDVAKIEHELSSMMGSTMAGPYCKNLDRALKALDR